MVECSIGVTMSVAVGDGTCLPSPLITLQALTSCGMGVLPGPGPEAELGVGWGGGGPGMEMLVGRGCHLVTSWGTARGTACGQTG